MQIDKRFPNDCLKSPTDSKWNQGVLFSSQPYSTGMSGHEVSFCFEMTVGV